MKRKYAYIFPIGNQLQWSSETAESLPNRGNNQHDKDLISDFIDANCVGSFIKLNTGEMVFQIT